MDSYVTRITASFDDMKKRKRIKATGRFKDSTLESRLFFD